MNKKFSKGSLLKGDGVTLCEEGYNEKPLKSYNIKNIKGKGLFKFTDSFNFTYYESGLLVILSVKRKRLGGEVKFLAVDMVHKKTVERRVFEVFSANKYSFKDNELHIKNNEISLDFVDGKKKNIKFEAKGIEKISLTAEITNNEQCSCVTANQFDDGFDYSKSSLGYNVEGILTFSNKNYQLYKNNDAVVAINSRLSVSKDAGKGITIFATGRINDKLVSVILDTISEKNHTSKSMIVYDGYAYKLEGLVSKVCIDEKYLYMSEDDSIMVEFSPHILHLDNNIDDCGIEVGKMSGRVILKNQDVVRLENFKAFVAYNGRIM